MGWWGTFHRVLAEDPTSRTLVKVSKGARWPSTCQGSALLPNSTTPLLLHREFHDPRPTLPTFQPSQARPVRRLTASHTIMADVQEPSAQEELALTTTADDGAEAQTATGGKKVKKIIRRKKRPARVQIDPALIKSEPPPQTGTIFNIWYNKWSGGDREDKYTSQRAAISRCNIAKDSGYTKADRVTGSYFCLFFARGICMFYPWLAICSTEDGELHADIVPFSTGPKGQDCEYLHRLPTIHDLFNPNVDCFGRDKFSDYRDDMGGVGSFMRQNRTV